jgi:hypothetical protein
MLRCCAIAQVKRRENRPEISRAGHVGDVLQPEHTPQRVPTPFTAHPRRTTQGDDKLEVVV